MTWPFEVVVDVAHRRALVGGEPMIFHCHHYNVFLQRTLLDARYLDMRPVLIGAGAAVAHAQLVALFDAQGVTDVAARAHLASELYRFAGFGTLELAGVARTGGTIHTDASHYAQGWLSRFGASEEPVCYFAQGFAAGALDAIHGEPAGTFDVSHPSCMACGASHCAFVAAPSGATYERLSSPGVGPLTDHRPRPVPETPVDYEGILAAVSGLPLVGDERGEIPAFGVMLTRHYASYYDLVSFAFLRRLVELFGEEGRGAAEGLLVEAGRVCAFNTFGGIMTSTEWRALIEPALRNREDWVHGMIAVANALGWGRWQVTAIAPEAGEFVIHDDYESLGYLASYGRADAPVSFLAQGGVEGLMNLVYVAEIASGPTLDPAFYTATFRRSDVYRASSTASRACGDEVTAFRVVRG